MSTPPTTRSRHDEDTVVEVCPTPPRTPQRPVLIVLEGVDLRRAYVLDTERAVIGRGQDCEVLLLDASCSRRHAVVTRSTDRGGVAVWVEDLASTNGTWVNGELVIEPRKLAEHDRLRVGTTLLAFHLRDDLELSADRRLVQLATVDPLTGLMNRGSFDLALDREIERASRYGCPLSLVLIDLDGFKLVNDTWGHPVGDRVLAQVAVAIRATLRHIDLAARHGGEEFAVLLTETGAEGALLAAERLRVAVSALTMAVGDEPVVVTASVGVVTRSSHARSSAELFAAADKALYRAKNSGRNRTVVGRV